MDGKRSSLVVGVLMATSACKAARRSILGNVQLVGMTAKELQDSVGSRRDVDADGVYRGNVYIFPLDIRQNTWKANNIGFNATGASLGGTFTQGAPTGRFIAPAGWGNCRRHSRAIAAYANLVLKGPAFFRTDASIVKRIKFTESMNLELRGEFLNAFNNINFLVGNAGADVNALGGLNANDFLALHRRLIRTFQPPTIPVAVWSNS